VLLVGYWLTIVGWDEGVVQMKLGEKARLDISSDFAYGAKYACFPSNDAAEAC
jgi:FKBP-type peptidyl-prolyl cis-trans isomerase